MQLDGNHNPASRELARGVFDFFSGLLHTTSRRFPAVSTILWLWGRLCFGGIRRSVSELDALGSLAVTWSYPRGDARGDALGDAPGDALL